jgi:flagellar hook-length control protein FliK
MLNNPAALGSGLPAQLNPPVAPDPAPQSADEGRAFAQALDRAAARQRDAAAEAAEPRVAATTTDDALPADGEPPFTATAAGIGQRADTDLEPARLDAANAAAPELAAWMSSLPLPTRLVTDAAEAASTSPAGTGAPDGTPAAAAFGLPANAATARQATSRHGRGMPPAIDELAGKNPNALSGSDAAARVLGAPREAPAGPRGGAADGAPAAPALPPAWISAAPRGADPAAPLQAELRPHVGSQEFAPALGSQLSVMVRNGIELAQLRLNPAELGPIEVRISIDGTQAQIDFSAASAMTRQALQEAVPALASALRESGLTLSGGGVFEQTREQRGDQRQDGTRHGSRSQGAGVEPPAGAAAAVPTARTRGVVDLYA